MATKKTASVLKGQVKLREKKLKDGSTSLYLDINVKGKRYKDYLKLYLVNPITPSDKEYNRQILAAANATRARRELDIINGRFDIEQPVKEGVRFLDFYRKMCEERLKTPDSNGNWGNWHSCLKHLEVYCDESKTFNDIEAEWIQGFKDYLNSAEKDAQKKTNPKVPLWVGEGYKENTGPTSRRSDLSQMTCMCAFGDHPWHMKQVFPCLPSPKRVCLVSKAMPYRPSTLFEGQCHKAVINKNVLPFTAGRMQDCRILTDAG